MSKNEKSKRILALRPGRREVGIAVLEGEELLLCRVANFRDKRLPLLLNTMRKRMHSLVQFYQPTVLAIEQVSPKRRQASPYLDAITGIIQLVALEANLKFYYHGSDEIRQHLCGSPRATGRDLVTHIIANYSKISRYAIWTSRWQESYWMPMFTAIAVGLVCQRKNS